MGERRKERERSGVAIIGNFERESNTNVCTPIVYVFLLIHTLFAFYYLKIRSRINCTTGDQWSSVICKFNEHLPLFLLKKTHERITI